MTPLRLLTSTGLAVVFATQVAATCADERALTIVSATDDGHYEETHGPENTIDGDFDPDSRWSNESQGTPKTLLLDLGAEQTLTSLGIAWYKGDSRKANFEVSGSSDGTEFQTIVAQRQSGGATLDLELLDFDPVQAQFVRIIANGNESNDWNSIVETAAYGCGVAVAKPSEPILTPRQGEGLFGLHVDRTPGENFDLTGWYITTPADDDGDGRADSVYENELAAGWTDPRYFYTDPATGGMVFRVTPAGAKTSANTSYTRTELRGMLRRGDYGIETRLPGGYPNANNWVFSSAPMSAQAAAGGVDGTLRATLAVNQVTRLGRAYQVGRVVIGQIHAKNDEPIRLYYRKLPKNKFGSIYFAHDPEIGKEIWVDVIGGRGDRIANPADGIALDEVFSYEIKVVGKPEGDQIIPMLHLKIIRDDGTEVAAAPFDMRASGFSVEDEFMFFKAGAYTGNNTSPSPETDFDRVIFYALDYEHDPAPAGEKGVTAVAAPAPAAPASAQVGTVFDDSFADGDRSNGPDPLDSDWWTTSNSSSIEIMPGKLGLVSGGSGRGIRTTFAPQVLTQGQTLRATYTFEVPPTVGTDRSAAFRVGLFDKLGRTELEADLSASSKKPNRSYNMLPGYMIDYDVNLANAAAANIEVRTHNSEPLGRLLGGLKAHDLLGEGGASYQFEAGATYTGTLSVKRLEEGAEITGTLSRDGAELSRYSYVDPGSEIDTFGMLAFHVNSKTFGSSKKPGTPDNGLDFLNVKLDVLED